MNRLAKKSSAAAGAKKTKKIVIALIAVSTLSAAALAVFSGNKSTPQVTAEEAREQLKEENIEVLATLPEAQRQERLKAYAFAVASQRMGERPPQGRPGERPERDPIRKTLDKLSEADRNAFREGMREAFQQRMKERMDKFFAATPEEQNKMLDEDIERMKNRRPPEEAKPGDKDSKPREPRKEPSKDARENRMRDRLNDSSPSDRAQMQEYFRRMHERSSGK